MAKKDTYWFPHDFNAHNDPKLIALVAKYGMAGYGMWWMFVEILRAEIGYKYNIKNRFAYPSIAKGLMVSVQEASAFISDCIIEFELLKTDDEYVWSQSLLDRMERWDRKKERLSENGRKGAAVTNAKKSGTKDPKPVKTAEEKEADLKQRQEAFYTELAPFVEAYGKTLVRAFYDYWSEPNPSRTKMKKELQKTWETSRRLATWKSRGGQFNHQQQETDGSDADSQLRELINNKK